MYPTNTYMVTFYTKHLRNSKNLCLFSWKCLRFSSLLVLSLIKTGFPWTIIKCLSSSSPASFLELKDLLKIKPPVTCSHVCSLYSLSNNNLGWPWAKRNLMWIYLFSWLTPKLLSLRCTLYLKLFFTNFSALTELTLTPRHSIRPGLFSHSVSKTATC